MERQMNGRKMFIFVTVHRPSLGLSGNRDGRDCM